MTKTKSRAIIVSEAFRSSRMQLARHRMVYSLLKDEMAQEGGIHALQLTTRTPEEEERQKQKEAAEQS
jgi:BolA protein